MTDETQTDNYESADTDALLAGLTTSVDNAEDEPNDSSEPDDSTDEYNDSEPEDSETKDAEEDDTDEYGNEKVTNSKTYTEDEVNDRINAAVRERLSRLERNTSVEKPVQNNSKDNFEYDENSAVSWQDQLEGFVKQTVSKMHTEQNQKTEQAREYQVQHEFEQKFTKGMNRFKDFEDVVKPDYMTDAMVLATRSMSDPAAFVYAAIKRSPDEIKRISSIKDPYAQMVEIGRLEERMKKSKVGTSAPRPLSKTKDDMAISHKNSKELSVEDLIQQSNKKRQAELRSARRK